MDYFLQIYLIIFQFFQSGLLRILISVKTIPYALSETKVKRTSKHSSLNDPTEAYTSFSDNFTQIFNECFPIKTRSKKFKIHKPWISNGLLKSIKIKNRLYKHYIRHPDPTRETK